MNSDRTGTNRLEVPSTQKWVPLSLMQIPTNAQRELNPAWSDHIAADMDVEKIGVFVVNKRGSTYWLVDGQHRREALLQIGWGDQQVQCQVFENLTDEQMAELFLGVNDKLTVPALPKFRISVAAGREREIAIDKIVRAAGCAVTRDKVDGGIGAVGTLIRIYERSGPRVLGRTIAIIRDAYGSPGFDAPVLDGLSLLCARHNGDLEDQVLVAKLKNIQAGVDGLMGRARLIREQVKQPLNQCVAAAATDVLNAGRGGKKLAPWFREDAA